MKPIVLLFSGQGAQKVGMGKDLFESSATARAMAEKADHALGFPISQIMFDGPDDELTKTSRCQPALYLHGLMLLALAKEKFPNLQPVAAAGLSLGEFTAHAAANTFSFEDGLRLVGKRGAFMEKACNTTDGTMAALIGGDLQQIEALAKSADVDIANLNAPGQVVLSGTTEGIQSVISRAKEFGIRRAIPLNVAGAYHSRLMKSAQDELAAELATTPLQTPTFPVVCNFTASSVSAPAEIRAMLANQVTGSVRWEQSIQTLITMGYHEFLELGPGKILAGLVTKSNKNTTVHSADDLASLHALHDVFA